MSAGEHQMTRVLGQQIYDGYIPTCPGWCNNGCHSCSNCHKQDVQPLMTMGGCENLLWCPHCDLTVEISVHQYPTNDLIKEERFAEMLGKQICSGNILTCPECGLTQPLSSNKHNRHVMFCLRCDLQADLIVKEK